MRFEFYIYKFYIYFFIVILMNFAKYTEKISTKSMFIVWLSKSNFHEIRNVD